MFLGDFVKRLDRIDQIVWEVMAEKGFTKIKELSEHFEIPTPIVTGKRFTKSPKNICIHPYH